jgi:hypothetical protein
LAAAKLACFVSADERERAALAWAETVTRVAETIAIGFRWPPQAALS